jgi:teichuronic acid exporter
LLPATVNQPSGETQSLKSRFLQGLAWTAALKWIGQIFAWAATIIVARILNPSDYGIFAAAMVYIAFAQLLTEFGLGTAVLARREESEPVFQQLHTVALFFGLGAFAFTILVSNPIARLFRTPELSPVLIALGSTFVISSLQTIPIAKLQKRLEYKRLAFVDLGRNVILAVAVPLFALSGFRFWSLVLANILGAVLNALIILYFQPLRFGRPRLEDLRSTISFSRELLVSRLTWYFYSNSDFLIVGKLLGQQALGLYSIAWNLATLPAEKINAIVLSVTPGYFSGLQARKSAIKGPLLTIMEAIALLAFPFSIGVALLADEFVYAVLGAKWELAITPLKVLSCIAALRMMSPVFSQVLVFLHDTRFEMWRSIANAVILPFALWAGTRWGITGVAVAWAATSPISIIVLFTRVGIKVGYTTAEFFARLRLPAWGTLALACAVFAVDWTIQAPPLAKLCLGIAAGSTAYAGSLLLLDRSRRLSTIVKAFRTTN